MKTVYAVGSEEVNPAGLVLTVTYADGRTEDIAYNGGSKNARQFTFSDIDFNEIGEQEERLPMENSRHLSRFRWRIPLRLRQSSCWISILKI